MGSLRNNQRTMARQRLLKWRSLAFQLLLFRCIFLTVIDAHLNDVTADKEMAKFNKLRMSPENYDKLKRSHDHLYYGAVKALMGQLGKNMYKELSKGEQRRLAKCLDRIENRFDLKSAAICLVEGKRRMMDEAAAAEGRTMVRSKATMAFVQELADDDPMVVVMGVKQQRDTPLQRGGGGRRVMGFKQQKDADEGTRTEAAVQQQQMRKVEKGGTKVVARSARLIRYAKNGGRRRVPRRVEDGLEQLLKTRHARQKWLSNARLGRGWESEASREGHQNMEKDRFKIKSMSSSVSLNTQADKPIGSRIANLLVKLMGDKVEKADTKWTKVRGMLARLAEETERRKKFPGTKVFEKRMYDIVLDRDEPSLSPKEKRSQLGLLHEGIKLLDSMPSKTTTAHNVSVSHNYRMFSPRFMPLAPDKGGPVNPKSILSPTLFAMYEERDNNSIGNVPEMLRSAGIGEGDRQKLIAGLMELTGSTGMAEKAMHLLKNVDFFDEGVGGPILKATERTVSAFFALEDSLDGAQRSECSQNGYTFARKEQIEKLMRDQSIDMQQLPSMSKFDVYDRMSNEEKEMALWATIESIALQYPLDEGTTHTEQQHQHNTNASSSTSSRGTAHRRVKRTFAPHLFEPAVLSPFQFAPIYGLVVMGPAILSPSTFSPYILGPSLFSPLILSPPIFSPLILAPSVASPWIVTPGVGNPYIISPYVFGPFILGPLVLHPFILSPYVIQFIISPNVLNPYVLSPIILNPIALSPDIMSPQILGGAVFSPAMLSPAIFTQTFLMVSIFSPTFLS